MLEALFQALGSIGVRFLASRRNPPRTRERIRPGVAALCVVVLTVVCVAFWLDSGDPSYLIAPAVVVVGGLTAAGRSRY